MVRINVIYYSMYGHVKTLIDATAEGLRRAGAEVGVYKVPELLPEDVLEKMHAKGLGHSADVPVVDRDTWHKADGFIFGSPTRFGMMASQMKAFWDGTGGLWASGALMGKPAGWVTSTGTENGGQETTILTSLTQLTHHGMIFVPHGYAAPKIQFDNSFSHGVSPYGVSTLAGPTGASVPSEGELEAARAYGERFAKVAGALATLSAPAADAASGSGKA